jgi:hypothetical protein
MENRIEINGVWYVREDAITNPLTHLEEEEFELIFSKECLYETDKYCFVASKIRKDDSDEYYQDISITVKEKINGDQKEYWDNNLWFKGILRGNPESIESLNKDTTLCEQGKRQFKAFLHILKEEGWLI